MMRFRPIARETTDEILLCMTQMESGQTLVFQGYIQDLDEDTAISLQRWFDEAFRILKFDKKHFTFKYVVGKLQIHCQGLSLDTSTDRLWRIT